MWCGSRRHLRLPMRRGICLESGASFGVLCVCVCLCVSGGAVREGSGEGGWFETVYGGVLVCSLNPKPETRNP